MWPFTFFREISFSAANVWQYYSPQRAPLRSESELLATKLKRRNGMRSKHLALPGILFVVFALSTFPAWANPNVLASATATADCNGYSLTVNAIHLTVGTQYTIDYTFTLTCNGTTTTVPGSISFIANATSVTKTVTAGWPSGSLVTDCTVTGTATLTISGSTKTIVINGSPSAELTCGGAGCPGTIGFWKNQTKHPFPDSVQQSGLTIAGVTYSATDLLAILNKKGGGNAVAILGKQLVGALVNLAAGAKHDAAADAAITTAETLLQANNLNLLTSYVAASSTLGQALLVPAGTLNGYNNGDFNTCSEGSGLNLGN